MASQNDGLPCWRPSARVTFTTGQVVILISILIVCAGVFDAVGAQRFLEGVFATVTTLFFLLLIWKLVITAKSASADGALDGTSGVIHFTPEELKSIAYFPLITILLPMF